MDYLVSPPEINSARIYAGPGAAPMMAAATAWEGLAASLGTTAAGIGAVVDGLTATWLGPSSLAMMTSASHYQAWLMSTAEQATQTAGQAQAAAAAFETAYAATIPPFVVAENRVRLATLVATNFLGVNTPAIAATEAEYMEFWAQDVAAMIGYHTASQAATQLTPFQPLTPLTTGVPTAPVSSATGTVQSVLGGLQGFDPTTGWSGLLNGYVESFLSSAPYDLPIQVLGLFSNMWMVGQATSSSNASAAAAAGAAEDAANAVENMPAPVVNMPTGASAPLASARLGAATPVGGLSVPQSWGVQAGKSASVNVSALTAADGEAGTPGFPGMPMTAVPTGKEQQKQNLKYLNRPRMLPNAVN